MFERGAIRNRQYAQQLRDFRGLRYPRQLNKVSDSDVGKWLGSCSDAALVRVYPAQDGESYLEVLRFDQQVRAKKSKFPNPPDSCAADAEHVRSNCKQMQEDDHLDVSVSVDVKAAVPAFVLPDWIPAETWTAYCKVRTMRWNGAWVAPMQKGIALRLAIDRLKSMADKMCRPTLRVLAGGGG